MDTFLTIAKDYQNRATKAWKSWHQFRTMATWDNADIELRQFWAYVIFSNEHRSLVLRNLRARYKHAWTDMDKFTDPTINPLRKVAVMKAVTYTRPPVRRTEHAQLRTLIRRNARHLNRRLLYGTKLLCGTGNVLLWPVLGMKNNLPIHLDLLIIPAHDVFLEWCYDDSSWNVVAQYDGGLLLSLAGPDMPRSERLVTTSMEPKKGWPCLGRPIWCSLDEVSHTSPRTIAPIADLINGSVKVGMYEAFGDKVTYLKSFKQPKQGGDYAISQDQLIAGPNKVMPADLEFIDMVDKNDVYEKLIQEKSLMLAGQHGVSRVAATGDYQNENHWSSVAQEMLHHWEEMSEICLGLEEELWQAVCQMELVGIDPDDPTAVVKVQFQAPYPTMQDPEKEFNLAREQQRAGVASITDYLMQKYPWIEDEEHAWLVHEQFLSDLEKELDMKRAKNIPNDSQNPGSAPVVNGQKSLDTKFGELGAEGPSADQKTLEVENIKNGGTP